MRDWNSEKKKLIKLIQVDNLPYEQIGKMYNCSGSNIRKVAKKLGIKLQPKRKINESETFNKGKHKRCVCLNCGKEYDCGENTNSKYCSNKCQLEYQYKQYIQRWKDGKENGIVGKYDISKNIRKYLFEKYNSSCQVCGWNKINPHSGKVPLQIHHIDGDCLNNKEENLQLLCPNCHSLTETFGNLNKKSKRVFRNNKKILGP
jgi:cytochrome b involved in lipid metabolism